MTTIAEDPTVIPPSAPPTTPAPAPAAEPPYSLARIFAGLLLVCAGFDFCFWQVGGMGLSVAVFVPMLAAAVLLNREDRTLRRSTVALGVLLTGACVATAVETGPTNTLVLLVLTLALAGDSYFDADGVTWARWFSQMVSLAFAPMRAIWLAVRVLAATLGHGSGRIAKALGGVLLILPTLVLTLVFGSLLASGNAVFGNWTGSFFNWLWDALGRLLDIDRIGLWMVVAFVALPLLCPGRVSAWWWSWIPRLPRLPQIVPGQGAFLSSALVLVMMNGLFAVANVADVVFLWGNGKLPAGVTYSGYVHSGVNTLTVTVLLSAVVLAGIFQQQLEVAGRRGLKVLGLLWIGQNLLVLVSVVLRLKLYIEAYDMTVARLSVILFLLLVAAGYGLLAIQIVREKPLPWLVGRCAVAIFATLYLAQFLNLAGWSADYNEAAWEKNRTRDLDVSYFIALGAPAWPAMRKAYDSAPENRDVRAAWDQMSTDADWLVKSEPTVHQWREFSLRAWWNRGALEEK
jgi:hypothetical protein